MDQFCPYVSSVFNDADFAGDERDRKSISDRSWISENVVRWHCKKQTAVDLSTAESEYVVASIGSK